MKLNTVNVADYLKTEQDIVEFLNDALESNNSKYIAHAIGVVARARTKLNGMQALADEANMTRAGLYKALSKDGNPRLTTLLNVTQSLGLKLRFEI